jgi:putative transcriptional regulator
VDKMDNSIIVYRDYGDIKFDIKSIMDKKGISINQVVKKTGLHHKVVHRYYDGTAVRYDKDVLSKLCFVLDCNLNDIMYYEKPKNK